MIAYLACGLCAAYLIGWLGDALMRAHARRDSWSKA
jgi:F0F1-type ATP synthase membrane subunit c/vacuolar-type H+-ATPase subunit K